MNNLKNFKKVVAMFLGVVNPKMNLGRVGWGLMIGWTIWCIIMPLIIEITKQIIIIKRRGKFDYNF